MKLQLVCFALNIISRPLEHELKFHFPEYSVNATRSYSLILAATNHYTDSIWLESVNEQTSSDSSSRTLIRFGTGSPGGTSRRSLNGNATGMDEQFANDDILPLRNRTMRNFPRN
jgi:hypothetical protein